MINDQRSTIDLKARNWKKVEKDQNQPGYSRHCVHKTTTTKRKLLRNLDSLTLAMNDMVS
jgi:hypothetical protein